MTPHAEPIVLPPPEAFLIHPRFVTSDLWVWPLFVVVLFFFLRGYHKGAGLEGRDIDLLIGVKTLNGLFLWGTIIALSRAVHRATDDVIVSGVWTGVVLTLSALACKAILKYSPLAPVDQRARAAIDHYRAEMKAREAARKEAKARGEVPPDEPPVHVQRDSPADARRQVSALMRKDLFAQPSTPPEAAPDPEKPPVA